MTTTAGRPARIGLPTYVERVRWGPWDRVASLLPHAYAEAVTAAGGVPVLLPPVEDVPGAAEAALDALDGLLLTGGRDLDPARYGAEPHPTADAPHPHRDAWDAALLHAALDRDVPVLAVCRGLQVLNVALGGTLHQHLPDVVGHEGHRPVLGGYGEPTPVTLRPGTKLAALLGDEVPATCHHHQGIDRLADGLVVAGEAADGSVEAAEMPDRDFVLAVQWHPEDSTDHRLFQALIAAANTPRGEDADR